jgi:hypothetical protein
LGRAGGDQGRRDRQRQNDEVRVRAPMHTRETSGASILSELGWFGMTLEAKFHSRERQR